MRGKHTWLQGVYHPESALQINKTCRSQGNIPDSRRPPSDRFLNWSTKSWERLPTTNKYPHVTGIQVDKLKIKKEPTGRIPATFRLARASNQGQTAISKANIKFQLSPPQFHLKGNSIHIWPYEVQLGRPTIRCISFRPGHSWTSTYQRNTERKNGINRHAGEWIYLLLNWLHRAKRQKHEDVIL